VTYQNEVVTIRELKQGQVQLTRKYNVFSKRKTAEVFCQVRFQYLAITQWRSVECAHVVL